MTDPVHYNDPRRLFELWKELTGEDLTPQANPVKKEVKQK